MKRVVLLLVLLSVSADKCTVQQNVDCDGSDLPDGKIGVVKDVAACCSACQANPACKAFTKHGPKDTGSPNACFLKSNCMGAQVANGMVGGVTSGVIPALIDCKQGHKGPSPTPATRPLPRVRPPAVNRTFTSPELEKQMGLLVHNKTWRNPELATLLWNCLPNTLDTTVWQAPTAKDPRSFLSTGDIPAMWLRDSQNQVYPYMRFAKAEPDGIGALIKGLIKRHVDSVLLDPYANSFDYFDTKEACVRCNHSYNDTLVHLRTHTLYYTLLHSTTHVHQMQSGRLDCRQHHHSRSHHQQAAQRHASGHSPTQVGDGQVQYTD
jgi:hypothetical protein